MSNTKTDSNHQLVDATIIDDNGNQVQQKILVDKAELLLDDADIDLSIRDDLLPDGLYAAVVDSVDMAFGQSGSPYLRVTFQLTEEKGNNRKISDILSFSEKALPITRKALRNLLGPLTKFNYEREQDKLYGVSCVLDITHRDYNGEDVNDVKSIRPPAGRATTPGTKPSGANTKLF